MYKRIFLFIVLMSVPSRGLSQFNPRQVPVEVQSWWHPAFGHIHAAAKLPVLQSVTGTLNFDVRIVIHNNPSKVYALRVATDDGKISKSVSLNLTCPFNNTKETNCAWSIPVYLDTRTANDGWRMLHLQARALSVEGSAFETDSEIPIYFNNGKPDINFKSENGVTKYFSGSGFYAERYTSRGFLRRVPTAPISGTYTFYIASQSGGEDTNIEQTVVDLDASHFIPAVGSWSAQPETTAKRLATFSGGQVGTFTPVTVDTTKLSNGWHTLSVKADSDQTEKSVCSYCASLPPSRNSGIAKTWFYVQN